MTAEEFFCFCLKGLKTDSECRLDLKGSIGGPPAIGRTLLVIGERTVCSCGFIFWLSFLSGLGMSGAGREDKSGRME